LVVISPSKRRLSCPVRNPAKLQVFIELSCMSSTVNLRIPMSTTAKTKKSVSKVRGIVTSPPIKRVSSAPPTVKKYTSPTGGRNVRQVITSGPALMKWRKERGISRKLFATMADCSERTLASCEKASKLPKKIERPVIETVRLLRALKDLAGDDTALKDWLLKPNPAFNKKPPLTLIKNGESDRLWEMICQLRQREFA